MQPVDDGHVPSGAYRSVFGSYTSGVQASNGHRAPSAYGALGTPDGLNPPSAGVLPTYPNVEYGANNLGYSANNAGYNASIPSYNASIPSYNASNAGYNPNNTNYNANNTNYNANNAGYNTNNANNDGCGLDTAFTASAGLMAPGFVLPKLYHDQQNRYDVDNDNDNDTGGGLGFVAISSSGKRDTDGVVPDAEDVRPGGASYGETTENTDLGVRISQLRWNTTTLHAVCVSCIDSLLGTSNCSEVTLCLLLSVLDIINLIAYIIY